LSTPGAAREHSPTAKEGVIKTLMLALTILIGLSAFADSREVSLLCRVDGAPHPGFNIRADLENSALTVDEQSRSSHYVATITPDYIEYTVGMFKTRIDRNSGDWVAWSYTGRMSARGSCQKTDDQRRLEENICCYLKPRE
jgi:hypothetical protein